MTSTAAQTPLAVPDYGQLLHELRPRMMFEVTEENLNSYLRNHPELFDMPEGFTAAYVAFGDGVVEVSALTRMLFVPTRVRVKMLPEVVRGRLRLKVHSIHAGPIPLPSSFHHGAADTIAGAINSFLDSNQVRLVTVGAVTGLIRVTAQAGPATRPCPTDARPGQ